MDSKTLCIHYNKDIQLITYACMPIDKLHKFKLRLDAGELPVTTFSCFGAYPKTEAYDNDAPSIFSNSHYPLRIYVGDKPEDCKVTLLGRPLGHVSTLELKFETETKPVVQIAFKVAPPTDVIDTLLDLGVEVIIDA